MKLTKTILCLLFLLTAVAIRGEKYSYDTVPGDPMKAKIYTLPNGLKLYMSVQKDKPRIKTNIAVRVGGKNDPAETTGLAHYFEHLMFKGTPEFGTSDYAAEKPMLDEIEQLFEVYRVTTDSAQRASIYRRIDSISYEASKIAIPNEYDKLMSTIGSRGTNAYTSYDETCYVEEIPSNQIDNWARIQAMRFKNPVLRGFHTELETIYEEKNMSLTRDSRKAMEKMLSLLFPNHPYGTQTVLGTQEHLKNPSITNVKKYHQQWYVPNNMAIVMSGDFDPDYAVDVITRYFGDMKPNADLQMMKFEPEAPITSPIVGEVVGQEAEMVQMAWRFPGAASPELETLAIIDNLLANGTAGLLDLNVNQQQRALGVGSYVYDFSDYAPFIIYGRPKEGQSLDDVRDIILGELKKLRDGDFDDSLLPAIINNFKKYEQSELESNDARVSNMVDAFIHGQPWQQVVTSLDRQSALTKADIVDFANKYLRDDNYVIVYKRQGKDDSVAKLPKPELTPIATNRDMASPFLVEIQNSQVKPIEPVFPDYKKDLTFLKAQKNIPVLYKRNDSNDLFSLTYVFETGSNADRLLGTASGYLSLLGTPDKTPEQIKNEFYALACDYDVSVGDRRSYITLSGLSENMPKAMALMEDVLANAVPDKDSYDSYAARLIKSRDNSKGNQSSNVSALYNYAIYGEDYVHHKLSNDELTSLDPKQLTDAVKKLRDYNHRIIYYGPMGEKELLATIKQHHYTPKKFAPLPEGKIYYPKETPSTTYYLAPYDSNQIYMYMVSNDGDKFDASIEPLRKLYNSYFGGDMSSIVFQEMRESRSLAYSASAGYSGQSWIDVPYTYYAFIATQNDKMLDALKAFEEIIEFMPVSDKAFRLAKDGLDAQLRTARTIKDGVAWSYIKAADMGYTEAPAKLLFEALPSLTLDDVVKFQEDNVAGREFTVCILGRIEDLNVDALRKMGEVIILTPEQIFGF